MGLLDKTGISDGSLIRPEHITRIYDTLAGSSNYEIKATGSFSGSMTGSFRGSINATGSFSGSMTGSFRGPATQIEVTALAGAGPYYLTYVDGTGVNKNLHVGTGGDLTYNDDTAVLDVTATSAQYADAAGSVNTIGGWTQLSTSSLNNPAANTWIPIAYIGPFAGSIGSPKRANAVAFKAKITATFGFTSSLITSASINVIDYNATATWGVSNGTQINTITFSSSSLPTAASSLHAICQLYPTTDGFLLRVQHNNTLNPSSDSGITIHAAIEYKEAYLYWY